MLDESSTAVNYRPLLHDLRNLFAVVSSAVNLMEEDPSTAKQHLLLGAIRDAAVRGAAATNKLAAPRTVEAKGAVDVLKLCLALRPLLAAAAGGHNEFLLQLSGSVAPVRVDSTRVEQAILELVSNARKATPGQGRITVRVHPTPGRVWIEVADRGTGFDKASRALAAPTVATAHGAGLPIISAFVATAKGRWRIFSTPGRGTIVAICLPIAQFAGESPARGAQPLPQRQAGEHGDGDGRQPITA